MSTTTISLQHTSLQFTDSPEQAKRDADKIFARNRMLLSGTESREGDPTGDAVIAAARKYHYRLSLGSTVWVAVRRDLITPWSVRRGYVPVLEASGGDSPHSSRGIAWLTFQNRDLGTVTHGCAHYLTEGREPGDENYASNRKMAEAIGRWARDKGRDSAIVFYAGDQNMVDSTADTFFGEPLTSAWDELDAYENTGHGNIDVIASYDPDHRVKALSINAKDDSEFPLATDHYLVDARYTVRHL